MKALLITLMLVGICSYASQIQMKACPGEGPHPFNLHDITAQLPSQSSLPTKDGVKDFVVAEANNALYYRNNHGRVYQMDLDSNESTLIARSNLPLSKVIDEQGRYLMTQKPNFLFDLFNPDLGWNYIGAPYEDSITPLYWKTFVLPKKRDVFFQIANWRDRASGKQHLTVYSYSNGRWTPNECNLTNVKGTLKLGEGHFAPDVFLYETIPAGENTKLRLWNINIAGPVFTCKPTLLYSYIHKIPGQVRSVTQFANSTQFAVRTTDRERNLIWTNKEDNKGCRYLNFAERDSFVINPKQPVIAAWNQYEGLTLVYPNEEKRATIIPGSQYFPIKKDNLWLSSDGEEIISAIPSDYNSYELYKQKLK